MKRIAVLLIISSVFFTACSSSKWVRTPVAEQREFTVTLEQRQEEGKIVPQQYAHPFQINTAMLEKIMKDLTYSEKSGLLGKAETAPVFQAGEIERLVPVLADTLSKTDSSQRLRFTSYNRAKALIFTVSRETEGVLFVEPDNQLNIAFSFINTEIDPDGINDLPPSFSKTDPLTIRTATTVIIPATGYARLHLFKKDQSAPMWVDIDLDKLDEIIRSEPAPPVAEPETMAPADQTGIQQTETPAPEKPSADMLQNDIKNKLKYLKGLLDEGLISEDDYNAKKTELLDKIE